LDIPHYKRFRTLDLPQGQSAFLWGARKTGKSTYLKHSFPDSVYIDLLKSDLYLKFLKNPHVLREEILFLHSQGPLSHVIICSGLISKMTLARFHRKKWLTINDVIKLTLAHIN
jgi:hypothetical protein